MSDLKDLKRTCLCLLLLVSAGLCAESSGEETGFTFAERFFGSYGSVGQLNKLDTSVGYNFNKHFGVAAGIPYYFVNSSTSLDASGDRAVNGLGNAYLQLNLVAGSPLLDYASAVTLTAPTGDRSRGFSTGRATFDWNNNFSHSFGRITPFVDAGVSNTIADSPFWLRPFSTLGLNGHFDGGASLKVWHSISIGASAYDVVPTGQQTIYSRVVGRQVPTPGPGGGPGRTTHGRVFETSGTTIGTAEIAKDNGYSAWVTTKLGRYMSFVAAYTHSSRYALDTASLGIGLNLGSLIKQGTM
jgi:hypothetical protein